MRKASTSKGKWLLIPLGIALVVVGGWIGLTCFEGRKPAIRLQEVTAIGQEKEISFDVTESGRGIREIWMAFLKDGQEHVLFHETLASEGVFSGTGVDRFPVTVTIRPGDLGIRDGSGTLRVMVRDASWRRFFKGNHAYVEQEVVVDTRPPEIEVATRRHYLTYGGTGVVAYRIPDDVEKQGVMVDGHFFPGHRGFGPDGKMYVAFFGLGHEKGAGKEIYLTAEDAAGNRSRAGFPYYVNRRRFPEDKIRISDRFLGWKMPEFRTPETAPNSQLEKFLVVNRKLRKINSATITAPKDETVGNALWKGAFLQLPNSANRAGFADRRIYYYNGKEIDRQFHMGLDLASIAKSPIPAANAGKIVLTDTVGIYGKCVVIDHGIGLFSVYAHMSSIDVAVGDRVKRGQVLGRTGATGMAGGDHLHFGIFVHDTFVNPIEWLDPNWVENHVASKLRGIASGAY